MIRLRWLAFGFLMAAILPAKAETLVVKLAPQVIAITSTFSGSEVSVFGAIDRDFQVASRPGQYDVIVAVKGPPRRAVLSQRVAWGPLWLTDREVPLLGYPSFTHILSSRSLETITTSPLREKMRLGLDQMANQTDFSLAVSDEVALRDALRRLSVGKGLWGVSENAVGFFGQNLFHARLMLPSNAPTGSYTVETVLLADGLPLAVDKQQFLLNKVGVDQALEQFVSNKPILYAVIVTALALSMGWLGYALFRRD